MKSGPRRRLQRPDPVPPVQVVDRGRPRTDRRFLHRVVRAACAFAGAPRLPVSLLLTDDAGIARLHRDHLGDPRPTDVITFDVDGTAEIVVSVETAARQARRTGHRVRDEVALYVVHGILHACGFDDRRPRARARMRTAERAILAALGCEVARVDA